MFERIEYRGCIRWGTDEEVQQRIVRFETKADNIRSKLEALVRDDRLVEFCLYRYGRMLFLYMERIDKTIEPDDLLAELGELLSPWPEENADRFWAPMYPVFWQEEREMEYKGMSMQKALDDWESDRNPDKIKIGRIAFLYPSKMASYVRYHQELVSEGLLKGDRYQFISLHENILFSVYEEPRNNRNISGAEKESEVIARWTAADPESHFDREKGNGANFRVIDPVILVDRKLIT